MRTRDSEPLIGRCSTVRMMVLLSGLMFMLLGCTSFMHGYTLRDYQGRLLSPFEPDGAQRQDLERGHDGNLSAHVEEHGPPDYLFVASGNEVYLLYIQTDELVVSRRSTWSSHGEISSHHPIPDGFVSRLPPQDRRELLAFRNPDREPAPTPQQPRDRDRPPSDEASVSSGTCFAVDSLGQVVTAHHVVDGATEIEVTFPDGSTHAAALNRWSRANDLALLQIEAATPDYLPVPQGMRPEVGERIFTLGYPTPALLGRTPRYSEGTVSSLSGFEGDASLFQVSVPVHPGNSGGPLLTEDGRLVGVIIATTRAEEFLRITGTLPQNMNWAVPVAYVAGLVEGPSPDVSPLARENAIELASRATCLVTARQ